MLITFIIIIIKGIYIAQVRKGHIYSTLGRNFRSAETMTEWNADIVVVYKVQLYAMSGRWLTVVPCCLNHARVTLLENI